MKKSTFSLFIAVLFFNFSFGQNEEVDIKKGDYKILKLDALNLMGLGVQKLHLSYEVSPMKQNENNLPMVNFNLTVPFNSLNEIEMNYGIEVGAELRFYQSWITDKELGAEGFYLGVGLDGGYVSFSKLDQYYANFGGVNKESLNDYSRVRTGIYFLTGAQSKLGDKLYFDVSFGMGWSNVNVSEDDPETNQNYNKNTYIDSPFYSLYREGKSQRFYLPVSFGLGYNFGNK